MGRAYKRPISFPKLLRQAKTPTLRLLLIVATNFSVFVAQIIFGVKEFLAILMILTKVDKSSSRK